MNITKQGFVGLSSCDYVQTETSIFEYANWSVQLVHTAGLLSWSIQPFSPSTGTCQLCSKEKFYIIYRQEVTQLNSTSEIFNHCRHIKSTLLFKPQGVEIICGLCVLLESSQFIFVGLKIALCMKLQVA